MVLKVGEALASTYFQTQNISIVSLTILVLQAFSQGRTNRELTVGTDYPKKTFDDKNRQTKTR